MEAYRKQHKNNKPTEQIASSTTFSHNQTFNQEDKRLKADVGLNQLIT